MPKKLKKPDLKRIRITDELFGQYAGRIGEKILDYQWKILTDELEGSEPTYCIENFRIAAGEKQGERKGVVFQDTDLYKWLESVAFSIAGGMAGDFEEKADRVIELIAKAQESDGYLNTYFQINAPERKWKNLAEGHELYTAGHMMEAAAAYYVITGKEKILEVAKKNADLICRVFGKGEGQVHGYPGHEEVEVGLIKLYRVTGEKKYLEQARYFIDERGTEPNYLRQEIERNGQPEFFPEFKNYDLEYSQSHKPPREQSEAVGHAVRDMYMCSAMADLAEEYEDKELETACVRIWNNMTKRRMYITGGIGSSGFRERFTTDYDLPNASGYCETCASIGLMMFGQRMASLTGKASYYDEVERALYNTVLAGINIEGNRYFYVNPLEVVPEFCTEHTAMQHVKAVRQKWFSVACCPPNIARTLASLGQYIYALGEDALYIHQFISSTISTSIGSAEIVLEMNSDLLDTGRVDIKAAVSGKETSLMIRIPGFSESGNVRVDESELDVKVSDGYIRLELSEGTHSIELKFDTAPKWFAANNNVREDAGKMALMKGPLVYCLEEEDNGDHLSEIYVEQSTEVKAEKPDERLAGKLPVLKYKGYRVKSVGVENNELYGEVKFRKEETELRAVPYSQWNNRSDGEMLVWQKAVV
ncbi:MAG: glycoside hydrolase family 127 protein [Lachnospiraceae bacterium]|nr:glycoside hydrolase family 127 protein [Lachnospiraceae bacterium]